MERFPIRRVVTLIKEQTKQARRFFKSLGTISTDMFTRIFKSCQNLLKKY